MEKKGENENSPQPQLAAGAPPLNEDLAHSLLNEQRRVLRLSPSAALDAGSGNQGVVAGPGHVLCALGESWRRNPHQ